LLSPTRLHHPVDQHTLAEPELLDHAPGHERIGHLAELIGVGVPEKAVSVGVHFEHASARFDGSRFSVIGDVGLLVEVRPRFGLMVPVAIAPGAATVVASLRTRFSTWSLFLLLSHVSP